MPSVSRHSARLGVLAASLSLLAGCSTTQEKAERQQARAQHILNARAKNQADGPKSRARLDKSARRRKGEG